MLDLTNVKNIIFDLGGVILNIDYSLTASAFKEIGVTNFDEIYSQAKQNNIFNGLETGELSNAEFRNYIKEIAPLSDVEIDSAWNAMLMDLPLKRISLLKELKNNYRLFLLSNTNRIHIKAFEKIIFDTYGENIFDSIFEKQYYSSKIGYRKPNEGCFKHVLSENKIKAEETLFIDDSIQHIEGASKIGLKTHHLQIGEDIVNLFPDTAL